MRDRVSVLRQRATASAEQKREAFAALRRGHIINLRQRHSYDAGNGLKLEN